MPERWAVAYEPCGGEKGAFQWLRDEGGTIAVFGSRWEARKWVLTRSSLDENKNEIVFVRVGRE